MWRGWVRGELLSFRLAKASLRNYRRVLVLSLGIILAVSLITGINIGVETISKGVLQSYLQNVTFDMSVTQNPQNSTYSDLTSQIASVQGVSHVEKVLSWIPYYTANLSSSNVKPIATQFGLIGVDVGFQSRYNVTLVQGTWNLTDGVVIPSTLAASLKVKPNDWINVSLNYPNATTGAYSASNLWVWQVKVTGTAIFSSVAGSVIFGTGNYFGNIVPFGPVPGQGFPIVTGYASLQSAFQSFLTKSRPNQGAPYYSTPLIILYRIFLNRDQVVNLFDADATLARLADIENQIRLKISGPFGYNPNAIDDELANAINSYRSFLQAGLFSFYIYSLPVLPISWYLAMTSWYMVTARKRREFGLLKVRGASDRRIFRTAILEAFIIGILGGIIGLFTGYISGAIIARLLGAQPLFAFSLSILTPDTVGVALFLGSLISILAALRPARMAASLPPTEAVKEYLGEEVEIGKPWRPTWTWGAIIPGTYKMLEWIFNFSPMTIFSNGPPGNNFIIAIGVFVWEALSSSLIIFGPFLFVYGVTKFITRSQNRLFRSTVLVLRIFMKDLANITARALSRNPARVSRVAFLIALTLTFGIFVNVVTASGQDLLIRNTRLGVGADINIQSYTSSINESFVSNLTNISGVSQVTPILETSAYVQYTGVSGLEEFGINASNFLNVAYQGEQITIGAPQPLFQKMQQTPNAALISIGLANYLKLAVGDGFDVIPNLNNISSITRFVVIGFYKTLPGVGVSTFFSSTSGPAVQYSGGSIIANLAFLRSASFSNSPNFVFLVKVANNANIEQVASTIRSLYPLNLITVSTFTERMQQYVANPSASAAPTFLELASGYLLLAAVLGFAIISWENTQERLSEIGIFRSRGASRMEAIKILFAESFAVLVIALIIGAGAGVISAYGFIKFLTSGQPNAAYATLDPRLIAPVELWILVTASIGGFLLSILIPAWLSLRKTVIQTVRFR
jgi:ABC-type lipoprotein release transport system permease subunit